MNTVKSQRMKIRWVTGTAALAVLLGFGAVGAPAASAQSAPPTLTGERLTAYGSGGGQCDSSGPFSDTFSGTATGPYPGTFSATVSGTVAQNQITSYTDTFTITSAAATPRPARTTAPQLARKWHAVEAAPRQTAPSSAKARRDIGRCEVRRAGFEPATRCLEGTGEPSRGVAWRRSLSHLTAQMNAGRGPASPEGCDSWVPQLSSALIGESGV
jgi:hypothetical protein